jgi:multimeric flavodoxin WrbA
MLRIALIQGSPRSSNNCPDQESKTALLAKRIVANAPNNVIIDLIDLSIKGDGNIVQPCKGCVSTSSMHCHFPCDCYVAGSDKFPDFMHNEQVYDRLKAADGILVLTPVHWYSVTSVLKSFFDRLVCINLSLTVELAEQLAIGKDSAKSRSVEKSGEFNHLLKNHFAGKYAAFLAHGDDGGVDYREFSDDINWHSSMPPSLKKFMLGETEGSVNHPRNAVMPLAWQCRYSGINVPDDLVVGFHATSGVGYAEAMDLAKENLDSYYQTGLELFQRLIGYLS